MRTKWLALSFFFILAFAGVQAEEANITLNTAISLAQNEYPQLATSPTSTPGQPVRVGEHKYWVVEFEPTESERIWVPVNRETKKILTDEEEVIKKVYRVHLVLQKIIDQREHPDYPIEKEGSIRTLLLVRTQEEKDHFDQYGEVLPEEIEEEAGQVSSSVKELESSLQTTLDRIDQLGLLEQELLNSPSGEQDITDWKSNFSSVMDSFRTMVNKGYAYNQARTSFVSAATQFISNANNSQTERTDVENFLGGVGISDIPESLPDWESLINKWNSTFLALGLSQEIISQETGSIYSHYQEAQQEESVSELEESASQRLENLEEVPSLIAKLMACADRLTSQQQSTLLDLNESYEKAWDEYQEGYDAFQDLEMEKARNSYINADAYGEEAENYYQELTNVKCPEDQPAPPSLTEVLTRFLGSTLGMMTIVLVVILVLVYFWNRKKKGEEEYEEDVIDWNSSIE